MLSLCACVALANSENSHNDIGYSLPIWSCVPFLCMLLSIAVFPLVKPHWWEKNMLKVSLFWSLVFLVPFGIAYGMGMLTYQVIEIVLLDYLPFIVLLFGLFVAAGGIVIKGSIAGTPKANLIMLLIGTGLASWIGTTGASMLMIRPLIRANAWREKKAHVVIFFIFMVSNIGGCLTPVGDPPLFLGFLRGISFFWTMELLPVMLLNIAILSVLFFFMDTKYMKKEIEAGRRPLVAKNGDKEPLRIEGSVNFVYIALIVAAVIISGLIPETEPFAAIPGLTVYGVTMPFNSIVQIVIILIAALLSWKTTKRSTRQLNGFTFGPIAEVAKLFIGIFITMIPALAILRCYCGQLGITEAWQFFWATGLLSSFLDNAPTYLVFLTTAASLGFTEGVATSIGNVLPEILMAVSAGSVFMGANTYIGNAPNFMVKSIAEENKIRMPSFFGYMAWSGCILIPVFIIDTFIFFL